MSIIKSALGVILAKVAMGFLVLIGLVAVIAHYTGADIGVEVEAFMDLIAPVGEYVVDGVKRLLGSLADSVF